MRRLCVFLLTLTVILLAAQRQAPSPLVHAQSWSTPTNISETPGGLAQSRWPALAVGPRSDVHAVWEDVSGDVDILYRTKPSGGSWSSKTDLSNNATGSLRPDIAVDGQGSIYVVWEDSDGSNQQIYFRKKPWYQNAWQAKVDVSGTSSGSEMPAIALGPDRSIHVVWEEWMTDHNEIYYARKPYNQAWASPVQVSSSSTDAENPDVAVDGNGTVHVVWDDGSGSSHEVNHRSRSASGTWSFIYGFSSNVGNSTLPAAAVAPNGALHVLWQDDDATDAGGDYNVIHRSRSAGGTWSAKTNVSNTTGNSYIPSISIEADGSIHVAWTEYPPAGDAEAYYVGKPYGQAWSGSPTNVSNDSTNSVGTVIAVSADGALHVAWYDLTSKEVMYSSLAGPTDTDGDGLSDDWETNGVDVNGDTTVDLDLPSLGADPQHRDIFVEIDYMAETDGSNNHRPQAEAVQDVVDAFAAAPGLNPDATTGIDLHVVVDERVPHSDFMNFEGGGSKVDFDTLKASYFGTSAERGGGNSTNALLARGLVFHYAIFGHMQGPGSAGGSSGRAELPGNDLIVSLGHLNWGRDANHHPVGTRIQQAGTLMHELGHNLFLRHGGGSNTNCKPNYLSVMSYSRQFNDLITNRPLDYSRSDLPDLDENSLNENVGVQGPAGQTTVHGPNGVRESSTTGAIDWNNDSDSTDKTKSANINHLNYSGCKAATMSVLTGYDDWDNLLYNFRGTGNYADGAHAEMDDPEIDTDIRAEMRTQVNHDGDAEPDAYDNCPFTPGPQDDTDNDDLGDVCDPYVNSSDGDADGITDFVEVWTYETDPEDDDTDGDGLDDLDEVSVHMTSPVSKDTDDDGMPDAYEVANSCLDALVNDAGADPDGDGQANLREYNYGADPCTAGAPVGGIVELPDVAGAPLETGGSSGTSVGALAGVVAAVAVGAIALGGAAWYARRRWVR